ncbi:MAG: hypothetical protein L0227_03395 [Chloroflexi bacterium]|nr:hypothetical protein [Chloroflexota bacterium]
MTNAEITCRQTTPTPSPRDYRDFTYGFSEAEWSAMPPTSTAPGHLIVAALLGGVAAPSLLIPLGTDAQPVGRTDVEGVSPADEGGRYYFDLGTVPPGRYLFAIGAIQEGPSGGYRGVTYLIALDVNE